MANPSAFYTVCVNEPLGSIYASVQLVRLGANLIKIQCRVLAIL